MTPITPPPLPERPSGARLRALKARAQSLDAILRLGHAGVTPGLVQALDQALLDHELVKLKFTDHKKEKDALAQEMATATRSHCIWRVGHVAVFFRPRPEPPGDSPLRSDPQP